jgi:hypothetical protein
MVHFNMFIMNILKLCKSPLEEKNYSILLRGISTADTSLVSELPRRQATVAGVEPAYQYCFWRGEMSMNPGKHELQGESTGSGGNARHPTTAR